MLMSKKCRWFVVHLEVDSEGRTFFGALILKRGEDCIHRTLGSVRSCISSYRKNTWILTAHCCMAHGKLLPLKAGLGLGEELTNF